MRSPPLFNPYLTSHAIHDVGQPKIELEGLGDFDNPELQG